jgi:protein-S-isoprenylcysteine O-methyltransferase Ste14
VSVSGSTPRIRLTQSIYLLALAAVAASDGRALGGAAAVLAQAAGFLLVAAAVLGRLWTTLFIAGRKGEQLVSDGPYSACRHPLYLCSVLAAAGIGLTARSLLLALVLPAAIGLVTALAARREERELRALHPGAWDAYRLRVPAFWPAWRQYRAPERVDVPTAIYRKAFLDAGSFLALWLAVLLAESLRAGGAWPALFRMP